ncbi:MAG: phytanoyl-CoA dioxygenase family protein [Saprospiraceae bacterium]|nr:phytanoyl-CoA dioxygenase family protein [Saprospiraceae bacterium]
MYRKRVCNDALAQRRRSRYDPQRAPGNAAPRWFCTRWTAIGLPLHFPGYQRGYKRRAYELINSRFYSASGKVLHQYRIITGNFYIKQPGKGKFEIHQNWMHTPDEKHTTVTIWCPLLDVDRRNGTLEIVPGSHKIVPDIATVNVDYYFKPFEEILEEKYLQPVVLKAGECMIFDDTLIHYSGQNTSDKPRIAIQIEAIPNEMTPVFYHFDKDNPEKGFELFEVDANFFLKGNLTNMHQRPTHLRSLGFMPNINRPLSESEFLEKMKTGPVTRKLFMRRCRNYFKNHIFELPSNPAPR